MAVIRKGTCGLVLAAVVASLTLASCRKDERDASRSEGGGRQGRASGAESRGDDRGAYVVGFLTDATGVARDTYYPECEGMNLYVKDLNARGGIHGHPVLLKVEDVQVDPVKAGAAAKKLTEEDRVLLLLGLTVEAAQPIVYDQARRTGTPVITGHSARPAMFPPADKLLFTLGNVFEMETDAHVMVSAKILPEGAKVGCYVHQTPAGVAVCERRLKGFAEKTRLRPGLYVNAPLHTGDFAPFAQRMINDRDDALWVISIASHYQGMAVALRRLGYERPIIAAMDASPEFVIERVIDQIGGANVFAVGPYVSADDRGIPELDRMRDAAKKYGTESPPSMAMVLGWTLGIAVEKALEVCGYPCERSQLVEILNGNFEIDTKGLTGGPIRWTAQDHTGKRYWMAYQYEPSDGRWVRRLSEWMPFGPEDVFWPVISAAAHP